MFFFSVFVCVHAPVFFFLLLSLFYLIWTIGLMQINERMNISQVRTYLLTYLLKEQLIYVTTLTLYVRYHQNSQSTPMNTCQWM